VSFIKVTAEELQSVSTQLNGAASEIGGQNATALNMVNGLVGQGWEGAASSQFDSLFTTWKTSADNLLRSLEGISQLLSQAGVAYSETEQSIKQSMTT
jgi:WXG100 family type VII secretion target